jgi:LacI family transcriptional regulator
MRSIAEACGVARPTVSMVLGGKPGTIALATRERILATARRLGYRPNAGAQAVKSGRFNAVGLLLDEGCYLPASLLDGLSHACGRRGLHLVVSHASTAALDGDEGLKLLDQLLVDGLLINRRPVPDAQTLQRIRALPMPVRWLNQRPGGGGIHPDDRQGMQAITRQLIAAGHRRIAFSGLLGGSGGHFSWPERLAGYRQAMAEAGLRVRELRGGEDGDGAIRLLAAIDHLRDHQTPDAIVCYSDRAVTTYAVAAATVGLRPGVDLILAAPLESQREDIGLTPYGLQVPWAAIAEAAVASLDHRGLPDDVSIPYQERHRP